jgi:hypothetical protein
VAETLGSEPLAIKLASLVIAIGIYSFGLVTLLNVHVLSSATTKDRAIILMADGLILFWIIIGGSLTTLLRVRLIPRLIAILLDWRLRFVLLCTARARFDRQSDRANHVAADFTPLLALNVTMAQRRQRGFA